MIIILQRYIFASLVANFPLAFLFDKWQTKEALHQHTHTCLLVQTVHSRHLWICIVPGGSVDHFKITSPNHRSSLITTARGRVVVAFGQRDFYLPFASSRRHHPHHRLMIVGTYSPSSRRVARGTPFRWTLDPKVSPPTVVANLPLKYLEFNHF